MDQTVLIVILVVFFLDIVGIYTWLVGSKKIVKG